MTVYLFEDLGAFHIRWFCNPPEYEVKFIVKKENWIISNNGKYIREIYEIELV